MNSRGMWVSVVAVALAAATANAQRSGSDSEPALRRSGPAYAGFWPTPKMVDLFINRLTEGLASEYKFDDWQLEETRHIIKERFPRWMEEHQAEIMDLTNKYFEALMDDEPPTPEEVADWAARAQPLINESFELFEQTGEDMRAILDEEQQMILDGHLAGARVAMNFLNQRLEVWRDGGYDWETEWPRGPEFRDEARQRHAAIEHERENARRAAQGLPPLEDETSAEATATVPVSDEPRHADAGKTGAPKDEWEVYVDNFIKRYKLTAGQQNQARRLLRQALDERAHCVKRLRLDEIEKQLKSDNPALVQRAEADLDRVTRAVDRIYDRMKGRLEKIPTKEQRQAAASAGDKPVGEKLDEGSIRQAMKERAAGGKEGVPVERNE